MNRPARWLNNLAAFATVVLAGVASPSRTVGQFVITEIIDASGDGAGNALDEPASVAIDELGNVYIAGFGSDNVFRITPAGVITEIIDETGDGAGNALDAANRVAVDAMGNVYATGSLSDNVFKLAPDGDGDGAADAEDNCPDEANADQADSDGNGVGDVCAPPPTDQTSMGGCGCGNGLDGIMLMPMMLLCVGWMRRR